MEKEGKELLIRHLINSGFLKSPSIISAFKKIPREKFVAKEWRSQAWADQPLPIGAGQTISAPHMVAIMTELLEPKISDRVLEIGAGSGYQAAILSKLVKEVWTVELVQELVQLAKLNIKKIGAKNVHIKQGDGWYGWPEHAPYDKIIVTCGSSEIPKPLIEQLKEGGRIVIPIGGEGFQILTLGIKKKGRLQTSQYGGCVFVPLRH
jgi:protein-L-isoaspartate(D-aspartate) O-methyltransferase